MARDTRERMVLATSKLLQRKGFHGTGLNQILAEAEAPKGSMYFHFPGGKDQLAAEAIRSSGDYVDRALRAHETANALESVDTYLADLGEALERSGFVAGCPIATAALEVGATTPEVGDACHAAFEKLIGRVAGWIEADGADHATASDQAFLIYSAIEGALVLAKAQRSIEPLRRLRAQLPRLLGRPTT